MIMASHRLVFDFNWRLIRTYWLDSCPNPLWKQFAARGAGNLTVITATNKQRSWRSISTIPLRLGLRLEWTVLERIFQRSRRDIISLYEERERERGFDLSDCKLQPSKGNVWPFESFPNRSLLSRGSPPRRKRRRNVRLYARGKREGR